MIELDDGQVAWCSQARAGLELDLGRRLWDLFNSDPILFYLRSLLCTPIETLAAQARSDDENQVLPNPEYRRRAQIWADILTDARGKFRLWQRWGAGMTGFDQLDNIVRSRDFWDVGDISDLVLFFGSVIEHNELSNTGAGPVGRSAYLHQRSARPGGSKIWGKRGTGGRHRVAAGMIADPHAAGPSWGARQALLMSIDAAANPGIGKFNLLKSSNLWKIDTLFGLPQGADISGTTADSIFFVEHASRFLGEALAGGGGPDDLAAAQEAASHLGDLLMLLPMATMVRLGHHTVLEIALTLTLNHYADYAIGQYTSLISPGAPANGLTNRVFQALWACETDPRNHRMLCFLDGGNHWRAYLYGQDWLFPAGLGAPMLPAGGVALSASEEIARFNAMAETSGAFLKLFHNMPPFVDRGFVDDFRSNFGL